MKKTNKLAIGAFIIGVIASLGFLAAQNPAYAAKPSNDVQISSTSDASVSNFAVTVVDNDIRVQFNYELANGATSAVIDAVLNQAFSMGQTTITGSGFYDQTVTGLPDGNYAVFLFISGNPDFLTADPGPSNQPSIIRISAEGRKFGMGDRMMRDFRQYFHAQQRLF